MLATLTSKGQVALPAPVSYDPLAVCAVLPKPPRGPVSDEGMRTAIAGHAAERFARSTKRRSRSSATERRISPTA